MISVARTRALSDNRWIWSVHTSGPHCAMYMVRREGKGHGLRKISTRSIAGMALGRCIHNMDRLFVCILSTIDTILLVTLRCFDARHVYIGQCTQGTLCYQAGRFVHRLQHLLPSALESEPSLLLVAVVSRHNSSLLASRLARRARRWPLLPTFLPRCIRHLRLDDSLSPTAAPLRSLHDNIIIFRTAVFDSDNLRLRRGFASRETRLWVRRVRVRVDVDSLLSAPTCHRPR
jgi:hypothetical protein